MAGRQLPDPRAEAGPAGVHQRADSLEEPELPFAFGHAGCREPFRRGMGERLLESREPGGPVARPVCQILVRLGEEGQEIRFVQSRAFEAPQEEPVAGERLLGLPPRQPPQGALRGRPLRGPPRSPSSSARNHARVSIVAAGGAVMEGSFA